MFAFITRRILFSVIVLFAASVTIFLLVRLAGDPLTELRANPQLSGDDIERIAEVYNLNDPLPQQYLTWVGGLLQGDLGQSFQQNAPVNEIIGSRVGPTILLVGSALAIAATLGVALGIYQAIKRYTWKDNALTFVAFLGFSIPVFFLGLMLQLVFAVELGDIFGANIFYTSGLREPGGGVVDLLQHLALPAFALAFVDVAGFSRFQRSAMLDVVSSDYLRTARAKVLPQRTVYLKHALRNALIPSITLLAFSLASVLGGSILVEQVFAWPGLGSLFIDSLSRGDYNVAQSFLMILAVLTVFFNLLADIVYALVDPRIRYD